MSKNITKNVAKNSSAKSESKAPAKNEAPAKGAQFLAKGAVQDALQGRVGARTHAIHVVLLDAARVGALLSTKEITSRATAFMQQTDDSAQCNATASHLNTMREKRAYLEREQGAWRLTDDALALCGAKWAQDASDAPAKKTKKKGAK